MSIISFTFIGLFLLAWGCYYLTKPSWRWVVLLVFSAAFYLVCGINMSLYLIGATLAAFYVGLWLGRLNMGQKDALSKPNVDKPALKKLYLGRKRLVLAMGLLVIFGALFAVKYLNFALSLVSPLFTRLLGVTLPELKILMPLGISFYSFQAAGYLVDVYRGKMDPERNLPQFFLFISFFPQMIQGPISNYKELAGQLKQGHPFRWDGMESAVYRILWGYFKKMVIADRLITSVTRAFDLEAGFTGVAALMGALLYCVEIYMDFSGGIDICRGVAAGFGIVLPENFRQPFFSRNLNEFWQRWHITLGRWMREYVFYPIAISKPMAKLTKVLRARSRYLAKAVPTAIGTIAVFFLVGVWHGASLKYIAFGLYFALFICLGTFFEPLSNRILAGLHISREMNWYKAFSILRTDFICLIGFFFARADRLGDALTLVKRSFTGLFSIREVPLDLTVPNIIVLLAGLSLVVLVSVFRERGVDIPAALEKRPLWMRWGIVLMGILVLLVLGIYGPGYAAADFIYMGF